MRWFNTYPIPAVAPVVAAVPVAVPTVAAAVPVPTVATVAAVATTPTAATPETAATATAVLLNFVDALSFSGFFRAFAIVDMFAEASVEVIGAASTVKKRCWRTVADLPIYALQARTWNLRNPETHTMYPSFFVD